LERQENYRKEKKESVLIKKEEKTEKIKEILEDMCAMEL
jgi:hypothetical protein